ncbi:MAG: glycosyltransferase [Bdellovibrionaceae bacterium]|nr:glycosyltransferase [Pseudobdellovibrionaceae bacterium]
MKIAWFAPAHSIHTVRWVNALVDLGHEVHLASFDPFSPEISTQVHRYHCPYNGRFLRWLNIWPLRRWLRNLAPDCLHVHYVSDYGAIAALTGFQPLISTAWGSDVFEYPNGGFLRRQIVSLALSKPRVLTSASRAMAEQMNKIAHKPLQIEVLPFGIDSQFFSPGNTRAANKPFRVGIFKSLRPIYGISGALRAFAIFQLDHTSSELLIAGDGPEEDHLKKLARELGIEKSVHFLGYRSRNQVLEDLRRCHVVLNLSLEESFGVAIVEALSTGVPVIATRVGGVPELIEDGINGYLVNLESVETDVPKALKSLHDNPELALRMGYIGRQKVEQDFDLQICLNRLINLYERVLQDA